MEMGYQPQHLNMISLMLGKLLARAIFHQIWADSPALFPILFHKITPAIFNQIIWPEIGENMTNLADGQDLWVIIGDCLLM